MEKKDNAFLTDVKKIWKYIKKARIKRWYKKIFI